MPPPNDNFETVNGSSFVNWHNTVSTQLQKRITAKNTNPTKSSAINYIKTTQALQRVLAEAMAVPAELRALGGSWSFSEVAATNGVLIDTWPLSYRFSISAAQKHAKYKGSEKDLHFVQCGNKIASISRYLFSLNKSLKTTGASNGQTIAGALSTGTHGSAINIGSVQDYIRSIHLITAPNKSVWLEREKEQTIADDFAKKFADKIIRKDNMFNAALVSFGSFGIIHGVVLESTDMFYLHTSKTFLNFDNALWNAITSLDFSGLNIPKPFPGRDPYHFKVVIDPNKRDQVIAEVIYQYTRAEQIPGCEPTTAASPSGQSDEAFAVLASITDLLGGMTKDLISGMFKSFYKESSGKCGPLCDTFSDTTTHGKAFSTAMGIPLGKVKQTLDIIFAEYDKEWAPALVALRFVRNSRATLAFTNIDPVTCIVEIDGPWSDRVRDLASRVWNALDQAGITYTFHWGKCHNLNKTNVRQKYGNTRINAWVNARQTLLPTPELRNVFANDFLRSLDLHG